MTDETESQKLILSFSLFNCLAQLNKNKYFKCEYPTTCILNQNESESVAVDILDRSNRVDIRTDSTTSE